MMSDTTVASAAAASHYQSGRFSQSLIELQRCHQLWEDERRTLSVPMPSPSTPSEDVYQHSNEENNDTLIMTATADDGQYENINRSKCQRGPRDLVTKRVELMALPVLALRADMAMVRFRRALQSSGEAIETESRCEPSAVGASMSSQASALSSSSSSSSTLLVLWEEANSSNSKYRRSLLGSAMSLIQSFGSTLPMIADEGGNETVIERALLHHKSTRRSMRDVSMALLMAGVAASHLHMYLREGIRHIGHRSDNNYSEENNAGGHHISIMDNRKEENAWSVLVDAAEKAAMLMRIRKGPSENKSSSSVIEDSDIDGADKSKTEHSTTFASSIEESLRILNEMLCKTDTDNDDNDEIERSNLAMHTFRSALSVAALATGQLILPKLTTSSRTDGIMYNNQCRVSKRQRVNQKDEDKSDPHHSNLKVTEDEDGGMNFRYSHSSPMLHSRCKLVDALSFHVAAIRHPVRREVLVNLRDACLNEAIECENRAAALYDVDVDDVDGVRAGYAWKIMHCLYGLEVAASTSSNSQPRDDITVNAKEELRKEVTEKRRRVIESLELLAPTSSRFANDWLGCVYATENDGCVRALEKFQSSLDIGERWSDMLDADEETAENGGLAVRRTTANLALCFLAMGDTNAPLELLLHLWMTLTESSSESSIVNNRTKPRAIALLLSPDGYEFESANRPGQFTKLQILWKLFQTSSIAQDWSTCLNATEEIAIHGKDCNDWQDESRVELARAFALLQCRRTSAAQDITRTLLLSASRDENKMRPRQLLSASLLQSIVALYHADALLLNEQIINYHDEVDTPYCTQRAVAAVDASLRTLVSDGGHVIPSNAPLRELQITAYNDHAISLIMSGDSVGALRYFREASKLSTVVCRTPAQDVQLCWLILPTYYNLSLLLMRDGHVEESAKSWLRLRGHFILWQQARRGDDDALRRMKELCAAAISLHGLLVAKRSVQGNAMLWDQENVLEWVPPAAIAQDDATEDSIRVGGVDALQITALDALLLNYASSTAEKKSSSSFRRRAGRLG